MNSLPFRISGVYGDFAELPGIARLDDDGSFVLEFQITDGLVGVFKSELREVRIRVADLEEVTFKRGLFSCALTLRVRRMGVLASIPGSRDGEIRLRCKRRHWKVAQELASILSMRLVDHQLGDISDSILRSNQSPPSGQ